LRPGFFLAQYLYRNSELDSLKRHPELREKVVFQIVCEGAEFDFSELMLFWVILAKLVCEVIPHSNTGAGVVESDAVCHLDSRREDFDLLRGGHFLQLQHLDCVLHVADLL